MNQSLSVKGIVPIAERNAPIEWLIPVLVSVLILSAELLSITAESSIAQVVEGQSTIYLAMMQ